MADGLPVENGSEAHQLMHQMSQQALRFTAEINVLTQLYQDYPFLQPTKYGTAWDMGPYEMPQENIPSGFEPTQDASRASKMLINGQLVIIKNGVRFNAVGAKL